jgi:hypothetical protein
MASPISTDETGKSLNCKTHQEYIESRRTLGRSPPQVLMDIFIHVHSTSRPYSHLKVTALAARPPQPLATQTVELSMVAQDHRPISPVAEEGSHEHP